MKKLIIAATILLFAFPAFAAEEFVPVTKDSEVTSIDQVQVKKVVTEQKIDETVYTLPQIDADIAKIQARIDHLQGDIDKLKALKASVLKEAEKIELKKEEAPKPIEEVK
jgi:TolA-binding protein